MAWDWITTLERWRAEGAAFAVATVVRVEGSSPCDPGAKLVVDSSGRFEGTIGGGNLEQAVLDEARRAIAEAWCGTRRYSLGASLGQCCGGAVEIFFEPVNAGPPLYLFGAGHVAQAVARVLEGTSFRLHAVDDRTEWLERMPSAVVRHRADPAEFVDEISWSDKTYALIFTHRHDLDQEVLGRCLRQPAAYLGLIGSRTKWLRFQDRLSARGFASSDFARVRCPIGIADCGNSPQEIAVSVAAELLALAARPRVTRPEES